MGFAVLALVAVLLAVIQHGWLGTWRGGPDLPLALAVWTVVAGRPTWSLLRAWIVGVACDLIDPGSLIYHTVAYSLFALVFLPMRGAVHRRRAAAWSGIACGLSLLLHVSDRLIVGIEPFGALPRGLLSALLTALAIVPLGWLLSGLPKTLRPIEIGGS